MPSRPPPASTRPSRRPLVDAAARIDPRRPWERHPSAAAVAVCAVLLAVPVAVASAVPSCSGALGRFVLYAAVGLVNLGLGLRVLAWPWTFPPAFGIAWRRGHGVAWAAVGAVLYLGAIGALAGGIAGHGLAHPPVTTGGTPGALP